MKTRIKAFFWTVALMVCNVGAQPSAPLPETIAIDIFLKPDASMMRRAAAANERLRGDYPPGFALDAEHTPHVTVVQAFVRSTDLGKLQTAVAKIVAEENPTAWELTATGYYDIPLGDRGLAGLVVRPTSELIRLQKKFLEAVDPYRSDQSASDAFVPRPDHKPIIQPTIDYVKTFAQDGAGAKFNPYVTIGWGNRAFLNGLKAEEFESFTFKSVSVEIFQLGEYGTAQEPLWTSAPSDPLPSWNDTVPKKAITAFVAKVTNPGSPDFVSPAERIATFDNDGTLWSEQPIYVQAFFLLDRIKQLAPQHPEWKEKEPFASILKGDLKSALAGGEHALISLVMATHSGLTTEEFEKAVKDWISTAKHPKTGRLFTEMVYQPMLELLAYLRANNFKTFIVSGGGIEFMRPWAEKTYGIPPEQVVGSSGGLKYELRDGKPVIVKTAELVLNDDKEGKPVGIQRHIGRRPIAAFGNSDGDLQMLQWTAAGPGPRFCLYVHHTDAAREWAYDRESYIGKLDKGLDEAKANGWTVVSMKDDWSTIFPARKN